MSERGDRTTCLQDDAVEEALSDHHLDEVAEMIKRAQADEPSFETPFEEGAEELYPSR